MEVKCLHQVKVKLYYGMLCNLRVENVWTIEKLWEEWNHHTVLGIIGIQKPTDGGQSVPNSFHALLLFS